MEIKSFNEIAAKALGEDFQASRQHALEINKLMEKDGWKEIPQIGESWQVAMRKLYDYIQFLRNRK
jgi:hypothetical protein